MQKQTVRDVDVRGRRVLLRTDYNVDTIDGRVLDDLRIEASLATLDSLRTRGARVVVCSHRGRPGGQVDAALSNAPLAAHLATLLGQPVKTAPDCIGPSAEEAVAGLAAGEVLLLENVRFHPEEEANDDGFARDLARLADVFVNDAFGALHRAHASIVGVPRYLPSAAGLLVEREVDRLCEVAEQPRRPMALVLGGAKITDKLPLVRHLLPRLDICLGGMAAIAVTEAACPSRRRATDDEALQAAAELLRDLESRPGVRLVLPCDVVATDGRTSLVLSPLQVPDGWRVNDVGPATNAAFQRVLAGAPTVVWNGPLGVVEQPPFDRGTNELVECLAGSGGRTVVAGGSTVQAARHSGLGHCFWHVSAGGGAALQLLAGQALPGLEALPDAEGSLAK